MIDFGDVERAAARIRSVVHRTPVHTSRLFNAVAGRECFFKCENLQRGGAFKIRGAANFLLSLSREDLSRGVVAFSSGNHAQAVAIVAEDLSVRATIVMPADAPAVKLAATRAYRAEVILYDRFTEDREAIGRNIATESGATLVPPFDHEWIMAGQGTVALELIEEVPDLDTVLVCVGGGGLFAGCLTVLKTIRPRIRSFGVEPERANDTFLSIQAGRRVSIEPSDTIADGLRATQPGALTFPVLQRFADSILIVSEPEIRDAMGFIASRMKLVVEPSGAVAAAAALAGKLPEDCRRVGIVISGGNVG